MILVYERLREVSRYRSFVVVVVGMMELWWDGGMVGIYQILQLELHVSLIREELACFNT